MESRELLEKVCESCDGDCANCKVYYKALKEKSSKMSNLLCCKNCRYCEQYTDNYFCKEPHSKILLMSKNTAVKTCCNKFEPNTKEYVGENSIPSFLWLVVFIIVFICAVYAVLEYSGIINYLSGLI